MSRIPKCCPHCGAPLVCGGRLCRGCDQPVAVQPDLSSGSILESLDPISVGPDARRPIPNPYRGVMRVMWTLSGLLSTALLGASGMAAHGAWTREIAYALGLVWLTFFLTHLIIWRQVRRNLGQAAEFLSSDRALARWTYTPEEWREIREAQWRAVRGDWKMPLGCLPALFGMVGLLVGLLVGAEDGAAEAFVGTAAGVASGALVGAVLGALVAGANYRSAWRAYRQTMPAEVALAPTEIYYDGQYFKADGLLRIEQVEFEPGPPATLSIHAYAPRYRIEGSGWEIVVPPRLMRKVAAVIPRIQASESAQDTERFARE